MKNKRIEEIIDFLEKIEEQKSFTDEDRDFWDSIEWEELLEVSDYDI